MVKKFTKPVKIFTMCTTVIFCKKITNPRSL